MESPNYRRSACRRRFPVVDVRVLRHRDNMTWIAEIIVQGFWEGAVEVAYRKWGWVGGAVALLGPFAIAGLALWIIFG